MVLKETDIEILKGLMPMVESYSAFGDAGEDTKLGDVLRQNGVTHVYCVGLAFDYCVGSTALSAAGEGFKTYIIKDATRSVAKETEEIMSKRLEDAGVATIRTHELIYGPSGVRQSQSLKQTQQTADFTRDENGARSGASLGAYNLSGSLEQKKVRIDDQSSRHITGEETRVTQNTGGLRNMSQKQETTGSLRFSASGGVTMQNTESVGNAKNAIYEEIKNSIMGLQSQMMKFESKIENKLESLENRQKALLDKVEAIESK